MRVVKWNGNPENAACGRVGTIETCEGLIFDQLCVILDDPPNGLPYSILNYLPCWPNELELVNAE